MDAERLQLLRERLGARIQALRVAKGWSQDVFAHLTGMGRAHPYKIERGKVDVQLSTIARMSQALGITLSELFADLDHDHSSTTNSEHI